MSGHAKLWKLKIKICRLPSAEGLPLPAYQSKGAAGFDLLAAVPQNVPMAISAGGRALVPTGLVFELPEGFEAQVRPRSGLAAKFGITVLNSPGTIDSDYRGEVGVLLVNLGKEIFSVRRGDRIAQVVVAPVARAKLREAKKLSKTERRSGGFGSTGVEVRGQRKIPAKGNVVSKRSRSAKT